MKQNEPVFGAEFDAITVSKMLNVSISDMDTRFPIQYVSTGIPAIIVPLKTLSAVKKSRPNGDYYFETLQRTKAHLTLVFSAETYSQDNHLNVRVFTDFAGIPEDPATGSGNGCLTAYLTKHRYFGKKSVDVRVEQGYEIARPSLLFLRGVEKSNSIEVRVGGHVILAASGQLV
jgi:trans-2,3-dihydro-3-hydroxyanthranilate isomerase